MTWPCITRRGVLYSVLISFGFVGLFCVVATLYILPQQPEIKEYQAFPCFVVERGSQTYTVHFPICEDLLPDELSGDWKVLNQVNMTMNQWYKVTVISDIIVYAELEMIT